ncbi:MAG: Anti-sigma-28 factor, FlgM [Pseudomonadota bacterium]|jgi:flagellar biosynthesis anti-sigma factor FlgM
MKTSDPKNRSNARRGAPTKPDMAALKERINQIPEVDTAHVVAVHTRISQGDYQVSAKRLADRILKFEAGLAPPPPQPSPRRRQKD